MTPLASFFPYATSTYIVGGEYLPQKSATVLYENFKNPLATAKPFVRWWWNGNRLSKQEILRELDILKEAGIGGVEINPIQFPEQADPMGLPAYDWLSEEWIGMLQIALQGAKERNIICDIIVGSGWPFGGEFLTKDEQTQVVAVGSRNLQGPKQYEINRKELMDEVEPYIHSPYDKKYKELIMLRLAPGHMETFEAGIDLTTEIKQEVITVDVPKGNHVLYYLVKLTGYQAVIYGTPGAKGPVLNHYNRAAVQKYLDRMSDGLHEKLGKLGNHFRAMFTDSLELEGANWCDDMLEQFKQRRGYSLGPYLPFVLFKVGHMGNPVEEAYGATFSPDVQETINRVRYDFEITRQELFRERFMETFQAWCEKQGVQSRVQAYGRGHHPLESSMLIDIPECETWLGPSIGEALEENNYGQGRAYSMINKFVSSGARLAGKKLISCEEITNTGMVFNATLERIKIAGDQSNLSGVTHSILHGFNYSPKEAPFPGWVRYGTFFNERNPWWRFFRKWADYKARLSGLFQQAELYSDIALMHPLADMWMQFGSQRDPFPTKVYPAYAHNVWEAIHQNGNGCDYISENILQNSTAADGRLNYGTRSYQVLLLMEVESMQPQTAIALKNFADAGGLILFIGKVPVKSPGLLKHEKNDKMVYETMQSLQQSYPNRVVTVPAPQGKILDWFAGLQAKFNIQPYVKLDKPVSSVSQVFYQYEEADIFFIANYSLENHYQLRATFNHVEGKMPWIWDPESGNRWIYPQQGSGNELMIHLEPATSKLIIFSREKDGDLYVLRSVKASDPYEISGSWHVTLHPVQGKSTTTTWSRLIDLKEDPDLQSFAGTIVYEKKFQVSHPDDYDSLDLGKVQGISEVWLNDQALGYQWYGEHRYDLGNRLQPGKNTLKIQVTTTLGNYLKSLKNNEVAQNWTKNQPLYSAGLMGPVHLL